MVNKYYKKKAKKRFEKKHVKISKSFWRLKRQRAKNGPRQIIKSPQRTKAGTTWVYKEILFEYIKVTIWSPR